ncbi:hypothetical protein ACFUCV_01115 [Specibacter sp. NPDC057265]|uniref:hypothetical protein n=1 Tax=Specibacter sp. NPDC057265 TaxID=3346075 RepID=UPI00362F6EC7
MSNSSYRRENSVVQSAVLFAIFMILFLAGIFAFSFWSLESAAHAYIPGAAGLILCSLAFFVPMTFIGRSDTAGE